MLPPSARVAGKGGKVDEENILLDSCALRSCHTLVRMPVYEPIVEQLQNSGETAVQVYEQKMSQWNAMVNDRLAQKIGAGPAWSSRELDDSSWETMKLPNLWEDAGLAGVDGIVWFRKAVDIPSSLSGQDLQFTLGPVDDNEETYFKGELLGSQSRLQPYQCGRTPSFPLPNR